MGWGAQCKMFEVPVKTTMRGSGIIELARLKEKGCGHFAIVSGFGSFAMFHTTRSLVGCENTQR